MKINKAENDGPYSIDLQKRLLGSGPVFGQFCYWLVKSLGYGVPAVIATSSIQAALPATAVGNSANITAAAATTGATRTVVLHGVDTIVKTTVPAVVGFAEIAAPAGMTATTMSTATAEALVAGTIVTPATLGEILVAQAAPIAANTAASQAVGAVMNSAPAISVTVSTTSMGAVAAGKAIVNVVGTKAAAVATGTVVAASNGAAGYVAAVETAATAAAAIGTSIPFLP